MPSKGFVDDKMGMTKKSEIIYQKLYVVKKSINVGTSIPNVHCIELWISCK